MNRNWLAALVASAICAHIAACTTEQDLGDRPPGTPSPDGGDGDGGGGGSGAMRVFVTKSQYTGNLQGAAKRTSGLDAADAVCQLSADGARLGGHWAAWLSDRNMDAIDRVDNDGPWVSMRSDSSKGRNIFLDRAGVGAGPIDSFSDEYGTSYIPHLDTSYRTASSPGGRLDELDCLSWSTDDSSSSVGSCGASRLLCLEQKIASYRKRVFVTSQTFTGSLGSGGAPFERADVRCNDAAKAGNLGGRWRAWLSYRHTDTRRAHDRLGSRVSSWTLVDGTTVAFSSRDQLVTGPEHAVDRDELNRVIEPAAIVWTGTPANGTVSNDTCFDYTSTGGSSQGLVGAAAATSDRWTGSQVISCDKAAHLYCFEQ